MDPFWAKVGNPSQLQPKIKNIRAEHGRRNPLPNRSPWRIGPPNGGQCERVKPV